jgi:hypothetical protein
MTRIVKDMRTGQLGNIAATVSIAIGLSLGAATHAAAEQPDNGPEACSELDSAKIDTTHSSQAVTMTASDGFAIVRYCVKAGSDTSIDDGAVGDFYVTSEANFSNVQQSIQALPETGTQTWIAFYLAIITIGIGLVITRLSRRPENHLDKKR